MNSYKKLQQDFIEIKEELKELKETLSFLYKHKKLCVRMNDENSKLNGDYNSYDEIWNKAKEIELSCCIDEYSGKIYWDDWSYILGYIKELKF